MRGQQTTVRGKTTSIGNIGTGAIAGQKVTRRGLVDRLTALPAGQKVEAFDALCKAWGPLLHEVFFGGELGGVAPVTRGRGRGRGRSANNLQA